jgi:hypothetical protein
VVWFPIDVSSAHSAPGNFLRLDRIGEPVGTNSISCTATHPFRYFETRRQVLNGSGTVRLPFDSDKLADIVCENEPAIANKPDDEEYTTFWLVIADQFAKRAIVCNRVRDKALGIIDSGADIAMHEKRGMNPSDRRKRQKMLKEVRERTQVIQSFGFRTKTAFLTRLPERHTST